MEDLGLQVGHAVSAGCMGGDPHRKSFAGGFPLKRSNWQAILFVAVGLFLVGQGGPVLTAAQAPPLGHAQGRNPLPAEERPGSPSKTGEAAAHRPLAGIDVSRIIDIDAIGFLSTREVAPWGHIVSDETERVILTKGDTVYVVMNRKSRIKPGDRFTVYRQSPDWEGYLISFLGRVVIKEQMRDRGKRPGNGDLYRAEIIKNYKGMRVGDPVLPFHPVSACVWPSEPDWGKLKKLKGCEDLGECTLPIVSSMGQREIMGRFSIIYLACGYNHGIRRGNVFRILTKGADGASRGSESPDVMIGHILILEARPDTATGLVLSVRSEFSRKAFVKGISWPETEKVVSQLPRCTSR